MSLKPNICVLQAPGINCDEETAFAFESAGAQTERVHISQILAGERSLEDYQALALYGGFSYGDDIRAGKVLGLELRAKQGDELNRFVAAGKAVIGICNGFQVLVETGLLPDGHISDRPKSAALAHNHSGQFECRWTNLAVGRSVCKFAGQESLGPVIELPNAHGEGRFVRKHRVAYGQLFTHGQVVFQYADGNGRPTEEYPDNPNGSPGGITGVTDPSGIILGMMPHPERFIDTMQHPNWRRGEGSRPFGAIIFKNITQYLKKM